MAPHRHRHEPPGSYYRALPWIRALADSADVPIEGTFMGFTEDDDFDVGQLDRFRHLAAAQAAGLSLGRLHAASSHAIFT